MKQTVLCVYSKDNILATLKSVSQGERLSVSKIQNGITAGAFDQVSKYQNETA